MIEQHLECTTTRAKGAGLFYRGYKIYPATNGGHVVKRKGEICATADTVAAAQTWVDGEWAGDRKADLLYGAYAIYRCRSGYIIKKNGVICSTQASEQWAIEWIDVNNGGIA